MATELQQMIDILAKDKGIETDIVIGAIEDAYLAASRKVFKGDEDLRSRFNPETGQVELYAVRQIVEEVANDQREISLSEAQELYGDEAEVGMEIEFPKETEKLGRIAAQTAKQIIAQRVREAEREKIHGEYSLRIGEVVTATVKRFESGDLIAEVGRVEAQVPRKEQSRAENYAIGDRVRAVIKAVSKNAKGPQVILSRTDPALLIKLFEMEVPEIYDGTVQIKGCVREAGERAKVAVYSRERDVDPVGACVGMKGTRVQSIIRELRGEKIDIVEWNDDPTAFVVNALSPAKVSRVSVLDEDEKIMEVVVEDKQLSLAIGKKGQNVRLAAKLVGWRIDIKSEEEKRQEVEAEMARMARIVEELRSLEPQGISERVVQKLIDAGVQGLSHILEMTEENLQTIEGIGDKTAVKIREAAAAAKPAWDARDEEAARVEAERMAAEQAAIDQAAAEASAEAAAQEAAEASAGPPTEDATPAPAHGEAAVAAAVSGEGTGEEGKPDGQR